MPYFINTFRVPKPGQFTTVLKTVEELSKASGRAGNVFMPISPMMPLDRGMSVVGLVAGFETLDYVDAYFNGLVDDDERMVGIDKVNAMCDQVNLSVSRILSPRSTPPEGLCLK